MISRALQRSHRTGYWANSRKLIRLGSGCCYAASRNTLSATRAFTSHSSHSDVAARFTSQKYSRENIKTAETYGIVTTNEAASTKPEDIIRQIPSPNLEVAKNYTSLFLLTKAFATWAREDRSFVRDAVDKLFANVKRTQTLHDVQIDVLVAVVDRIPDPIRNGTNNGLAPAYERGCDGLAFCVAMGSHMLQDVFEKSAAMPVHHALDRERQSIISFASISEYDMKDTTNGSSTRPEQVIQLPLATTVFENGLYSTLIASKWAKEFDTDRFQKVFSKALTYTLVHLPFFHEPIARMKSGLRQTTSFLKTPLVPITELRVIKDSLGNILRHIDLPFEKSAGLPASQGLEKAVSDWFVDLEIRPKAVLIWALVMPHDLAIRDRELFLEVCNRDRLPKALEQFKKSIGSYHDPLISRAIKCGARLHRVLSGGGGWGKKAGLLALDPDLTYDTDTSQGKDIFREDAPNNQHTSQFLREVASPGDYICFYIDPQLSKENTTSVEANPGHWEPQPAMISSIEFGVIPSTVDVIPTRSSNLNVNGKFKIEYFERYFGALSEAGMVYEYTPISQQNAIVRTHRTKVDVPYSHFFYKALEK